MSRDAANTRGKAPPKTFYVIALALPVAFFAALELAVRLSGLAAAEPLFTAGWIMISTAMAILGDLQMAVGPKPARKWSGLGPLAGGAAELRPPRRTDGHIRCRPSGHHGVHPRQA